MSLCDEVSGPSQGPPCFLHIWVVLFSSTLSFGVLILLVPSPWVMNFLPSAQLASPSIGVSCSPLSLALPATLTQSLPSPPGLFSHYHSPPGWVYLRKQVLETEGLGFASTQRQHLQRCLACNRPQIHVCLFNKSVRERTLKSQAFVTHRLRRDFSQLPKHIATYDSWWCKHRQ